MLKPIGYGHYAEHTRVLDVLNPKGSSVKKRRRDAAKEGLLLDCTSGNMTRSIIVQATDSDHHPTILVLCALQTHTVAARLNHESTVEGKKDQGDE